MDAKRYFRPRHVTPPGREHVTRQITDLSILDVPHRFGPQTVTAVFQIVSPLYKSYRAFLKRVELLRQLENTDYGGPLLFYPPQQCRGALNPERNHMVIDVTPRGERLLKNAGLFREHRPVTSGQEWKHDFMGGTITASIYLPIKAKPERYRFGYEDEVIATLGCRAFQVPSYRYKAQNGEEKWREGAVIRPDGFFSIEYLPDRVTRIFLKEENCGTEPYRSDNTERKSYKQSILAYHALLSDSELRRRYFGDVKIGVLNTFTTPAAMRSAMEVHKEELGTKGTYMLYNVWDVFGDFFKPPPPRPDLFHEPWQRVGQPPFYISRANKPEPRSVPAPLQPSYPATRLQQNPVHARG